MTTPCLLDAWSMHETELLGFLRHHLPGGAEAQDLLHDVFLKATRQGARLCAVRNPRAWLFEVARNTLIDHLRRNRNGVPLPDDLVAAEAPETPAVDALTTCLPRVLAELSAEDSEAIRLCDLEGMTQARFAELTGLSLPGAKSRLQRARQRLRVRLIEGCRVEFDESGRICSFVPRPPRG